MEAWLREPAPGRKRPQAGGAHAPAAIGAWLRRQRDGGGGQMSRPPLIPETGDRPVAVRMGYLGVRGFEVALPALTKRGFPRPDQTTGHD